MNISCKFSWGLLDHLSFCSGIVIKVWLVIYMSCMQVVRVLSYAMGLAG